MGTEICLRVLTSVIMMLQLYPDVQLIRRRTLSIWCGHSCSWIKLNNYVWTGRRKLLRALHTMSMDCSQDEATIDFCFFWLSQVGPADKNVLFA